VCDYDHNLEAKLEKYFRDDMSRYTNTFVCFFFTFVSTFRFCSYHNFIDVLHDNVKKHVTFTSLSTGRILSDCRVHGSALRSDRCAAAAGRMPVLPMTQHALRQLTFGMKENN
jgi:hypothetical protein